MGTVRPRLLAHPDPDLKLNFYAFDQSIGFDIKGAFTYQDVKFRLGKSKWFLGAEYTLFDSQVEFQNQPGESVPGVEPADLDARNGGLAALAYHDSRDTTFTPSKGREARIIVTRYDQGLGGDFDYWRGVLDLISFHQVHADWVVGWRLKGSFTTDGAPFWGFPFVWMRGIPAMRYQGETVAQAETEVRWDLSHLWSVVGFAGYGDTWSDTPAFETQDTILAGGAGFRLNIAEKMGFRTGIDVARGPEDWAIYLQFGHAWTR